MLNNIFIILLKLHDKYTMTLGRYKIEEYKNNGNYYTSRVCIIKLEKYSSRQ